MSVIENHLHLHNIKVMIKVMYDTAVRNFLSDKINVFEQLEPREVLCL